MISQKISRIVGVVVLLALLAAIGIPNVAAKESTLNLTATVYQFDKDAHYEIASSTKSSEKALGTLTLVGDMCESGTVGKYKKFTVNTGNFSIAYSFNVTSLNVPTTSWHITEDKTKQVNGLKLDANVLAGAVIVQSSRDGHLWQTEATLTNVFNKEAPVKRTVFTSNDLQLQNGHYYRIVIVYKQEKQIESSSVLGMEIENFEYRKLAEVYEFYAVSGEQSKTASPAETPRRELGVVIRTEKDSGYTGSLEIDKDDPHFDMKLGTFVVNGYTRETKDGDVPTFLKNTGDKVTLWFTLDQDITCLCGDETLSICEDTNGYEVHSNPNLSVNQTNLKHGALIIRVTDHEGNTKKPIIYTDFLAANARTGADTKVQLFEEGDYEVSLLYEIEKSNIHVGSMKTAPTYTNYKINFKFKIRNGNCIVFPFDSVTGKELSDGEITPNGFRLDMAKSRYLTIDVKREVTNVNQDGTLTLDERFNKPAKDGAVYSDGGIYTVVAKNLYTDETTVKTFFVGTDKYMLAMSRQGYSLEQLNTLIRDGAIVEEDGTVIMPAPLTEATEPATEATQPLETTEPTETTVGATETQATVPAQANAEITEATVSPVIFGASVAAILGVVTLTAVKKKKASTGKES